MGKKLEMAYFVGVGQKREIGPNTPHKHKK